MLRGCEALAHGLPLAYGGMPCENVAYIGCHDNLTIWDTVSSWGGAGGPEVYLTI